MSVAAGVAARNCDARLRRYWRLKNRAGPTILLPRRKLTLQHYAYASNARPSVEAAAALRRLLLPRLGPRRRSRAKARASASLIRRYLISGTLSPKSKHGGTMRNCACPPAPRYHPQRPAWANPKLISPKTLIALDFLPAFRLHTATGSILEPSWACATTSCRSCARHPKRRRSSPTA